MLNNEHQSAIGSNDNDNRVNKNSLDSMSDVSMDDVTYMNFSLNDSNPTDDSSNYDDDIIMEFYVL